VARSFFWLIVSGLLKPVKSFSIRFRLLELTMGCVLFISIVQFSRIKFAFAATKITITNLLFFVKHFFYFFEIFFSAFLLLFASAKVSISLTHPLVNVFLSEHFYFFLLPFLHKKRPYKRPLFQFICC